MNTRALTQTDLKTALLLAQGCSRKVIAKRERISINSVKSRVDALLFKTNSFKAAEAVHKLTKQGLLALVCCLFLLSDFDDDKHRRHTRRSIRPVITLVRGA